MSAEEAFLHDKINYRTQDKNKVLKHFYLRTTYTMRARTQLYTVQEGERVRGNTSMALTITLFANPEWLHQQNSKNIPQVHTHHYITIINKTIHLTHHKNVHNSHSRDFFIINGPQSNLKKMTKRLKELGVEHMTYQSPTGDLALRARVIQQEGRMRPLSEEVIDWALSLGCVATPLEEYHLREGEVVLGIVHPSETTAANGAVILPGIRAMLPAGRGRWWAILPPVGWDAAALTIQAQGCKLITHSGQWHPGSSHTHPPNYTIHNIPAPIPVQNIVIWIPQSSRHLTAVSNHNAEPHSYNILVHTPLPPEVVEKITQTLWGLNPGSGWVETREPPTTPPEDEWVW